MLVKPEITRVIRHNIIYGLIAATGLQNTPEIFGYNFIVIILVCILTRLYFYIIFLRIKFLMLTNLKAILYT